jgi:tRNA threonylcarbamoyladenosine biosynthesis protein TsaB
MSSYWKGSMKILGIDTSTKYLCIGICDGNKAYVYNLDLGRNLSGLITVTIKRVLDSLSWRIQDIDYFACGLGPGSFTGMRVGIATIKGFAFSLKKPVIGIPTLDILARNAVNQEGYIVPVVDAKRNLIYTSMYRNKKGKISRIEPYMLLTIAEFFKKMNTRGNPVILGDALSIYKHEILINLKCANVMDKDYWFPQAGCLIDLALEKIKRKQISSASEIKPLYLYPKECQVRK